MKYQKPPRTFAQQVALLRERGLIIPDPERAERYLSHLNYYRFAGYVLPFEQDHATHRLVVGTTFDDVLNLYVFDRELRLLVLDALERIEVSARTQWAYHLSHASDAHGYLRQEHTASARGQIRLLAVLEREIERSSETFLKHFKNRYTDPDMPPVWAACEVMSLDQLSKWYSLHHIPRSPRVLRDAIVDPKGRRIYAALCLVVHLMDCISPGHSWRGRLNVLLDKHAVDTGAMGFPEDWKAMELWNR